MFRSFSSFFTCVAGEGIPSWGLILPDPGAGFTPLCVSVAMPNTHLNEQQLFVRATHLPTEHLGLGPHTRGCVQLFAGELEHNAVLPIAFVVSGRR